MGAVVLSTRKFWGVLTMPTVFMLLLLVAGGLAIAGMAFPNRAIPFFGAAILCAVVAFLVRT